MELNAPAIEEGEKFGATLTFEKAAPIDVEFAVDKAGGDHSAGTRRIVSGSQPFTQSSEPA